MNEVLAVAALAISLVTLLLLLRVASRTAVPTAPAGTVPVAAPVTLPPPPAGTATDAAVLVRLDMLEAKVSVLEARSAQPLPAALLPRADDEPDAESESDAVRRPHPMFP